MTHSLQSGFGTLIRALRSDLVLAAAWILALISMTLVPPSAEYIHYIDFRSLGILWSLMVIMKAFQEYGVFEAIGRVLLDMTTRMWQLTSVLVFLCFFFSMLITNDVALITFVPFSIMILCQCGRRDLLIPVIVLQTIAANLGSMMTPIGNPQNLYLYGLSGMGIGEFTLLLLPYTLLAGAMLCLGIVWVNRKKDASHPGSVLVSRESEDETVETSGSRHSLAEHKLLILMNVVLFLLALLVVARILPYTILFAIVLIVSLVMQRGILPKVDYMLLLTFVGFFLFTGNMAKIPAVSEMLGRLVAGHEVVAGVLTSQCISNVPAALLISNFADSIPNLILGVNFGGLGTLIASMASLISYKLYAAEEPEGKGRYMVVFTVWNLLFLAVLMIAWFVLG